MEDAEVELGTEHSDEEVGSDPEVEVEESAAKLKAEPVDIVKKSRKLKSRRRRYPETKNRTYQKYNDCILLS